MGSFQQLLSPDFMPHGFCYLWDPRIVWLHVISDGLIALSYYCIPVILIFFIRKNRDLPFNNIFWMFGTFILACGTTHLMEIWNVWHGSYLLAGVIKAITAAVSVATAAVLVPLVPKVISLPGRIRLQEVNHDLELEIAERQRTEEVRGRLAAVVESSDDAIISKTLDGTITAWNPGAEKLFGYSSLEAVGKPMRMLLPPERAQEESAILARIGYGERVDHFETVRVRKDGKRVDVSVTISPIKNSSGAIVGASNIARDITEHKRAESDLAQHTEALARSRQELETQTLTLRSVLESMAEGLVAADEQGKFVIWNTAAEKILGLGPTNLPSEKWTEHYGLFLPDMVTPFPNDQLPLVLAIQGEASTTEMFVRNPELTEGTWIEVSGSPRKDRDGIVNGGVVAFRDVTRRKADEREILRLNEDLELRVTERTAQLEAANKELESFSYSVSHDLRAPLRHIIGFSKMLVEEFGSTLDPAAHHYLERIQAGTQKMGLLVDELLNLARLGRHALNLRPTGLNALVAEVVTILQPDIEGRDKGREVEWLIADLPQLDCDPVLVTQVFQNLLANALKFTRKRAHAIIEVGCQKEKESGQAVLMVRDNGTGFSMKYVDKLFGVFQRLHNAEDFEGTGIGLATVQRIVHKHGGRVWAEGEVDKGAASTSP